MKFNYTFFVLSGLAFGSQASSEKATEECKPGQYYSTSIGINDYVWETQMKPQLPPSEWPKVCGPGTTKCGMNGAFQKCVDDTWVDYKCACPGLTCSKGAMFNECRGTATA